MYIIGEYDVGNDGSEDKEEEDDAIFIFLIGGGGCFDSMWCGVLFGSISCRKSFSGRPPSFAHFNLKSISTS